MVRELDWRRPDIGDRVLELFQIKAELGNRKDPLAHPITEKLIMSALPLIEDPRRLARTELAEMLGLTMLS